MIDPSLTYLKGQLFIVATPIGNLEDISFRAVRTLKEVSFILCEDTRHSKPLLQHYGIDKPLFSFHAHNENGTAQEVIKKLNEGQNAALISDAGTPLLSDPGYPLVKACIEEGVLVTAIPGASALLTALCVSGFSLQHFSFEGFLPAKGKAKRDKFEEVKNRKFISVFYESPHRILDTLELMGEIFEPTREIVLGRELTKRFESIYRGKVAELKQHLANDSNAQKGEFVLIVSAHEESEQDYPADFMRFYQTLKAEQIERSTIAKILAKFYQLPKREIYNWVLQQG